ncbi:hypothetical protein MRY87_08690, partial [bacterium]|nr:hypothetical protein [bacterium]
RIKHELHTIYFSLSADGQPVILPEGAKNGEEQHYSVEVTAPEAVFSLSGRLPVSGGERELRRTTATVSCGSSSIREGTLRYHHSVDETPIDVLLSELMADEEELFRTLLPLFNRTRNAGVPRWSDTSTSLPSSALTGFLQRAEQEVLLMLPEDRLCQFLSER